MSSAPRIAYTPRPDATPEGELASLANVYGFILACHAKKNAAGVTSTDGDDAKEGSLDDCRATASIP
ncbi:MAG: hypothetical protein M3Q60_10450 [Actinomycetota bacterium]|nr:hypothetical protein [Actinomycetota bacterium]